MVGTQSGHLLVFDPLSLDRISMEQLFKYSGGLDQGDANGEYDETKSPSPPMPNPDQPDLSTTKPDDGSILAVSPDQENTLTVKPDKKD